MLESLASSNMSSIYTQRASQDIQKFGFQLHRQIASLQTRLPLANADTVSRLKY